MKTQFNDDTFLARWLNNNLTNEELVSFKQTKEYKEYTKINGALDRFEAPKFRQKAVLQSINDQLKPTKVKKLVPNWMYAAAASIALLFSVVYFLTNSHIVSSHSLLTKRKNSKTKTKHSTIIERYDIGIYLGG